MSGFLRTRLSGGLKEQFSKAMGYTIFKLHTLVFWFRTDVHFHREFPYSSPLGYTLPQGPKAHRLNYSEVK